MKGLLQTVLVFSQMLTKNLTIQNQAELRDRLCLRSERKINESFLKNMNFHDEMQILVKFMLPMQLAFLDLQGYV